MKRRNRLIKKDIYVVGAVIIDNGRILCAKRGMEKSLPRLWEFPGGKIEQGETPQESLRREIQEEMHCEVEIGEQVENTSYKYDFGIVHLQTYYCKLTRGTPVLTENTEIKWLSAHELPSLEWAPADISAIEKAAIAVAQ